MRTKPVVLMMICAAAAHAQEVSTVRSTATPWRFNAAYYGETVTHPGLSAGVERELVFFGRRFGLVEHGLFAVGSVGAWWHARYAVGAFAESELGYRLVFPRGFQLELLGGVGYLHTFDAGPVYAVTDTGQVARVVDGGHPGLMLSGTLGLGWDFRVLGIAPLVAFLRAGVFGQYPYNTVMLPHLQGQLGVSIPFGGAS